MGGSKYKCDILNLMLYMYVPEYWVPVGSCSSSKQETKMTIEGGIKITEGLQRPIDSGSKKRVINNNDGRSLVKLQLQYF